MDKRKYIEKFCTGCGLCESSGKAVMDIDSQQFPNVKVEKNADIEFFENVCPVFYYEKEKISSPWGVVDSAIVGYSSNADTRFRAASGGALTEIAIFLLESNRVDAVIQVGVNPADPTNTVVNISKNRDDVLRNCGSRYSISTPLKNIIQIVDRDKKYAFIGKPCDVMAIKRYLLNNKQMSDNILYTLSFFCAGEPSVEAQNKMLARMQVSKDECSKLTYRGNGWPGFTTAITNDGIEHKMEYKEAWGQYLGRDIRYCCRFCMDGTGELADIVCADFWQLDENGKPDFSEHDGRNIVLCRNPKASKIVKQAIFEDRIKVEVDFTDKMNDLRTYQPHQYRRKTTMEFSILAMKLFCKQYPKFSKENLKTYSTCATKEQKWDSFIGTVKRILKGKI